MGKMQRRKGHNFERKIAAQLNPIYPQTRRGLQYRDGEECCDVEGTPFHIECSCGGQSIWAKIRQAQEDSHTTSRPWVVIKKQDFEKAIVVMDFETFKGILKELKEKVNE